MASVSPTFNESGSCFNEKLELSLAYAERVIAENEEWLLRNAEAKSKLMKLFSKCQCYLEELQTPILYSTLDPTSAPFVARTTPMDPSLLASVASTPVVQPIASVPAMIPAPAPTMAFLAPTWVPPPTVIPPRPLGPPMVTLYPTVPYQLPYHQPMPSPPLWLNPCPFQPAFGPYQPDFAYPGQPLAPSPPLMTSPISTLRSSPYSPESSMSLPATPVISPEPAGFPTFVPTQQGPVFNCGFSSSSYPTPYGYPVPNVSSYSSCYGLPYYGPMVY